jgi:hypothetical protein
MCRLLAVSSRIEQNTERTANRCPQVHFSVSNKADRRAQMGIFYKVDPVAKNHDFKQKGPTCWYYVAKMMLKFHGLYDGEKKDEIYDEWKSLHAIRKIIFELKFREGDPYKLASIMAKLKIKLDKVDASLKKAINDKESDVTGAFVDELNEKIKQCGQKNADLTKAAAALDQLKEKGLSHRKLVLQTFVPSGKFKANVFSDNNVEKHLRTLGPLYVSGGLIRKESQEGLAADGATMVCAVTELNAESHHAVLLIGASGDVLFYIDPNKSDQVRQVSREILFKNVKRVKRNGNRIETLYPVCKTESEDRCMHCKERGAEI